MQTKLITPLRAAQTCLTPVAILKQLLGQHYGLQLNDTPFGDDGVIQKHIDAGIILVDALNFIVEKYELVALIARGLPSRIAHPLLPT